MQHFDPEKHFAEMNRLRMEAQIRNAIRPNPYADRFRPTATRIYPHSDLESESSEARSKREQFMANLSPKAMSYLTASKCLSIYTMSSAMTPDTYELRTNSRAWLTHEDFQKGVYTVQFRNPAELNASLEKACNEKIADKVKDAETTLTERTWLVGKAEAEYGAGAMMFCRTVIDEEPTVEHPELAYHTEYVIAVPVPADDRWGQGVPDALGGGIGGGPLTVNVGDEANPEQYAFLIVERLDLRNPRITACMIVDEYTDGTKAPLEAEHGLRPERQITEDNYKMESVDKYIAITCMKPDPTAEILNASFHRCGWINDEILANATREAVTSIRQNGLER